MLSKVNFIILSICMITLSCAKGDNKSPDVENVISKSTSLLVMPEKLVEYANSKGYTQVSDFYVGSSDIINPPFVYGIGSGPPHESAAFWAQKQNNDNNVYYLMFYYEHSNNKPNECPDIIKWDRGSLGGLMVDEYIDYVPDEEFFFINDSSKQMSGKPQSSKGILSYRVGLEVLFFCYDNDWMLRIRH